MRSSDSSLEQAFGVGAGAVAVDGGAGQRLDRILEDTARPVDDTIFLVQKPFMAYAVAIGGVIALELGLQIRKEAGVNVSVEPVEPGAGQIAVFGADITAIAPGREDLNRVAEDALECGRSV